VQVGDLVKSKYTGVPAHARIGIVIKLREGAYEGQPLAQVFWPHRRDAGWVEAKDMEVIGEGG
jgi:hypothetical protein